jgi:hypothetical protein
MADFNITINEIVNETIGETVSAGDILYLATDTKWYLADASLLSKSTTELRVALENGVANAQIQMLVAGYVDVSPLVLVPGTKYYLSNIAGEITTSLLTSNTVRYVGTAFDNTTFLFNPDQTYIHDNARKINGVTLNFSHTHLEADITDLDKYTQAEVDALITSSQDRFYVHTQAVSSASWVIAHSLDKYPSVTIQDGLGNTVYGDIVYTDTNNLTLNFSTAFTGIAYLN